MENDIGELFIIFESFPAYNGGLFGDNDPFGVSGI